jgi:hypothetical protein
VDFVLHPLPEQATGCLAKLWLYPVPFPPRAVVQPEVQQACPAQDQVQPAVQRDEQQHQSMSLAQQWLAALQQLPAPEAGHGGMLLHESTVQQQDQVDDQADQEQVPPPVRPPTLSPPAVPQPWLANVSVLQEPQQQGPPDTELQPSTAEGQHGSQQHACDEQGSRSCRRWRRRRNRKGNSPGMRPEMV